MGQKVRLNSNSSPSNYSPLMIKRLHSLIRVLSINDVKAFGLDSRCMIEEKGPISVERPLNRKIRRVNG